jgi:hypothetical protein
MRFISLLVFVLLALASTRLPAIVAAEEPNQAALAILFLDGRIETRCVTFEEDAINGADLLNLSGLDVLLDSSSGMGITVCQVEGLGCAYPAEDCFCQCMTGSGCAYWNYYYRDPGEAEWTYSPLGILLRESVPGSAEAWVWGDGHTPPPADLTFDTICAPSAPTSAHTSPPPSPSPAPDSSTPDPTLSPHATTTTVTPTKTGGEATTPAKPPTTQSPASPPTRAATQRLATTAAPQTSSEEKAATDPAFSTYWPFGLMLLGLVAIGGIIWLRRS